MTAAIPIALTKNTRIVTTIRSLRDCQRTGKTLCKNRLVLGETLQEEFFLFQTKEQNNGYDQGQNQEDGRDQPIGNPSEEGGFWNRSEHSGVT